MEKEVVKINFSRAIIATGNVSDAIRQVMIESPPIGVHETIYFSELAKEASDLELKIQKSLVNFQQRIKNDIQRRTKTG